jgi:hypothetical protein
MTQDKRVSFKEVTVPLGSAEIVVDILIGLAFVGGVLFLATRH